MAYDDYNRTRRYSFAHDFGNGDDKYVITGPKGKKGRLIDYGIEGVTETFTNTTTAGSVAVGTVADPDAYGDEYGLGTTAADAGTVSIRTAYRPGVDAGFDTYMLVDELPADTPVALNCVGPTGGTPAGIATAFMVIVWDK